MSFFAFILFVVVIIMIPVLDVDQCRLRRARMTGSLNCRSVSVRWNQSSWIVTAVCAARLIASAKRSAQHAPFCLVI